MSEFYAAGSFLDRKHLFTKYYSIISCISLREFEIEAAANSLKQYSGFGIEAQIANLDRCCRQLRDLKEDVRTEFYSLVKIVDTINDHEKNAKGILGGGNSTDASFALVQPAPLTKTLSHSDIGKLKNQLKYYSQNTPTNKKLYDYFCKAYEQNISLSMTDDEYATLKNMFALISNTSYVYSSVEYFTDNFKTQISPDTDLKYKVNSKEGKSKAEFTSVNAEASAEANAMVITVAAKNENDYANYIIKLSNVKAKGELNIGTVDIENVLKQIKSGKIDGSKLNSIFEPLGIQLSGSASCVSITQQTIKHVYNGASYFVETNYNIGELTAEGELSSSEAKGKLGISLASVEGKHGVITNDGKITLGGKARAGVEYGAAIGKETEVSVGLLSLSLDIDDGMDFYVWQ